MKSYERTYKVYLLWCYILTFCLPLGIFLTAYGGVKENWLMMGPGIAMIVAGFYGTPIIWCGVAEKKQNLSIYRLIVNESFSSVDEIADNLMLKPKIVENVINSLMVNGYLSGYKYKNGNITINENKNKNQPKSMPKRRCPTCGGLMKYDGSNYDCPYCGNIVEK